MKRYRVIQYATGGVGSRSLQAILDHPQLELVGLLVHSADKAGRDAGELLGRAPVGVKATQDLEAILALDADCVLFAALWPDVDTLCRMLESGKNVVATSGWLYPKFFGPELVARLEAACAKGGVSVHGTGINPGFSGEVLPLTMSALSRRIDSILIEEFADFMTYNSPELNHDMIGFGRMEADVRAHRHPNFDVMMQFFHQSIAMVADGLSVTLDRIEQTEEYVAAPADHRIQSGPIPKGSIAGVKTRFAGIVAGQPCIVIELKWIACYDLGPGWPTSADANRHTQWTVTIEGEPSLRCVFEQASSFDKPGAGQSHTDPAMWATAMHAVNAIVPVCEAKPGIRTFLDLPIITGRYALR